MVQLVEGIAGIAGAEHREPAEPHREEIEQQDRHDVARRRDEADADDRQRLVEQAALADRRIAADRDADQPPQARSPRRRAAACWAARRSPCRRPGGRSAHRRRDRPARHAGRTRRPARRAAGRAPSAHGRSPPTRAWRAARAGWWRGRRARSSVSEHSSAMRADQHQHGGRQPARGIAREVALAGGVAHGWALGLASLQQQTPGSMPGVCQFHPSQRIVQACLNEAYCHWLPLGRMPGTSVSLKAKV